MRRGSAVGVLLSGQQVDGFSLTLDGCQRHGRSTTEAANVTSLLYRTVPYRAVLTLSLHPHLQTLPQPAELAAVAVVLVDDAVLFAAAAVGQALPHAPLEEAFTSFTTDCSVVPAWTPVN